MPTQPPLTQTGQNLRKKDIGELCDSEAVCGTVSIVLFVLVFIFVQCSDPRFGRVPPIVFLVCANGRSVVGR